MPTQPRCPDGQHRWVHGHPGDDDPWCSRCGVAMRHDEHADEDSLDALIDAEPEPPPRSLLGVMTPPPDDHPELTHEGGQP